jgi:hypothetical protein
MCDETYQRVRLRILITRNTQKLNESKPEFMARLAEMVGLSYEEADSFIYGALRRRDV